MFDSNLMLLDAGTLTGVNGAGDETGAWVDLWSENADIGPALSEFEQSDPPGQGGAIRSMVWTLIVGAAGDNTDAVTLKLEWSDDGSTATGVETLFANSLALTNCPFVERQTVRAPSRYVRYSFGDFDNGNTVSLVTLGPVDGGEYTDF